MQLWILVTDTLAFSVLSLSSLGPTLAAASAWFSSSSTSFIGAARCTRLTSSAVSGRRSSLKQLTVPLTKVAFPTPVSPSKRMAIGLLLALGDLVRLGCFASGTSLEGSVIRVR